MNIYQAKYTDAHGSEEIAISNDGEMLRTKIRGVEFACNDFDSFEPSTDATPEQLSTFTLNLNELCSCSMQWEVPIPIHDNGNECSGNLECALQLGEPTNTGHLDSELLQITLQYGKHRFAGSGKSGWFEDELNEIQNQLPAGVYMQACINCLYSDYSPLGHGLFGYMMCFRNIKDEYLKVSSKTQLWPVLDKFERSVQETYLCPEFKRRVPGTGYRE